MAKKKRKTTKRKEKAMAPNVKMPTKKQLRRYGSKDTLQPGGRGGFIGPSN